MQVLKCFYLIRYSCISNVLLTNERFIESEITDLALLTLAVLDIDTGRHQIKKKNGKTKTRVGIVGTLPIQSVTE